jgi:acyl-CoA thioester hydrolase|tara:strand:- start:747 stop:1151 length:405 start_codon:yes stop_codon:yes gene_type:complete
MISFDHRVKIFYKDVDQMGVVYYSRYFEYFEEARTELLASIGLGVTDVEKKGIMLPVISSHCDYLKGARFEQNIIIRASISTEPRSKLQIDYSVFIENEKEPIATGYTDHAFVNDRGVAVRAPKMILERLNQKV